MSNRVTKSNSGGGGSGTVTTVSVVSANGFSGTVANATTTPAITLKPTITGLLKGTGTAIVQATAGTDYLTPTGSGSGLTGIPTSVSNSDGSLTISPTTGSVVASIALGHSNVWTAVQSIAKAPVATANSGTFSVGGGPFDGSTSGYFVGSSSGTSLAINEASGYGGNLLDLQTAGVSKFSVTGNGNVGIGMAAGAQTLGVKYSSSAYSGITLNNLATSAAGPTMTFYSANSAKFQLTTEAAWQGAGSDQTMVLGAIAGGMYFYTNNSSTAAMYLNSSNQLGIGTTSQAAILDITSTTSGMLPPRMTTTQKNAIGSPPTASFVYDTTLNKLSVYTGAAWETVTSV